MSRTFIELECGCMASCDGGGGLIPCDSENCKFDEWVQHHPACPRCGECLTCRDHDDCKPITFDEAMELSLKEYTDVWKQFAD